MDKKSVETIYDHIRVECMKLLYRICEEDDDYIKDFDNIVEIDRSLKELRDYVTELEHDRYYYSMKYHEYHDKVKEMEKVLNKEES